VLDEPSNGLDPDGIRWLRGLLKQHAAAGGTVLLSSHQISEVAQLADDLVVLAKGRVVASGPCAEIGAGHESLEDAFFALTRSGQPGEQQ
jgi:ABC-2 type transport system ATP-binding protein